MKDVIQPTPDVLVVQGGSATGKTEHLVNRVMELMGCGCAPEEILVLAATPNGEATLRKRIASRLGNQHVTMAITTPRAFALDVLSSESAVATMGYVPRLLNAAELNVVMEDVRTTGLKQSRIRNMLRFFYRQFSELLDDEPGLIVTGDEEAVMNVLQGDMAAMHGLLEPQLSNKAVHCLLKDAALLQGFSFQHVMVDDYQLLSRASQALCNLLAVSSIAVAHNPSACYEVYEQFPYAKGVDELVKANGTVRLRKLNTCQRSKAVVAALNTLRASDGMQVEPLAVPEGTPNGSIQRISSATCDDEFAAVLEEIQAALRGGLKPADIAVMAPNRTWVRNLERYLRAAGVKTERLTDGGVLHGDIRDSQRCKAARVLTMLNLVANPHDAAAWRSWCGYGNYTGNSVAFTTLGALMKNEDYDLVSMLGIIDKLPTLNEKGSVSLQEVSAAYKEGLRIIDTVAGLKGTELLERITAEVLGDEERVPGAVLDLTARANPDADALGLFTCALTAIWAPAFSGAEDVVRMGGLTDFTGTECQLLVFAGATNGFLPKRDYFDEGKSTVDDQLRIRKEDIPKLHTALASAAQRVVFTTCEELELETAERLKLQVERIRVEDDTRIARLSPCILLEGIG